MENQDLEVFDDGEFNNEATSKETSFHYCVSYSQLGFCWLLEFVKRLFIRQFLQRSMKSR